MCQRAHASDEKELSPLRQLTSRGLVIIVIIYNSIMIHLSIAKRIRILYSVYCIPCTVYLILHVTYEVSFTIIINHY